jgi:hypothetical protein
MFAIIALVLIAIVALTILGFAMHLLFSPWLLLAVIGILVWVKVRPGRSHQSPAARPRASVDGDPPGPCRVHGRRPAEWQRPG